MKYFKAYLLIYLGLGLIALGIHSLAPSTAHVVVSIIALVILTIGALQALALAAQNYILKQRSANTATFLQLIPPVETLRNLLFKTLWAGFIFLSVSYLGAFIFLPNALASISIAKLIFSVLAWILFAAMLYGSQRYGWRNDAVSMRTLLGVLLLAVVYWGSRAL